MIGDQCPSKTFGGGFEKDGAKTAKKVVPILIVDEDLSTLDPPADNVMQRQDKLLATVSSATGGAC
jgi:hypothetical protein